jgi:hypothetical protein
VLEVNGTVTLTSTATDGTMWEGFTFVNGGKVVINKGGELVQDATALKRGVGVGREYQLDTKADASENGWLEYDSTGVTIHGQVSLGRDGAGGDTAWWSAEHKIADGAVYTVPTGKTLNVKTINNSFWSLFDIESGTAKTGKVVIVGSLVPTDGSWAANASQGIATDGEFVLTGAYVVYSHTGTSYLVTFKDDAGNDGVVTVTGASSASDLTLTRPHVVDTGVTLALGDKVLRLDIYGTSLTVNRGAKLTSTVTATDSMWAKITVGSDANAKLIIKGEFDSGASSKASGWIVPDAAVGVTGSDAKTAADFILGTGAVDGITDPASYADGSVTYSGDSTNAVVFAGYVKTGTGGTSVTLKINHVVAADSVFDITNAEFRLMDGGTLKGAAVGTSKLIVRASANATTAGDYKLQAAGTAGSQPLTVGAYKWKTESGLAWEAN